MASSRLGYVTDANVLIDLHWGQVLRLLAAMPDEFVVADVTVAETEEPTAEEIGKAGLRQESLPGDGVLAASDLLAEERRISAQDAFALVLAERTGRVLLTGEKRLRALAERRGVEVHGTLWLLERMIDAEVLALEQAADALDRMLARGRRLPAERARELMRHWRK
jgi:predicted nucleic acid-binding protein